MPDTTELVARVGKDRLRFRPDVLAEIAAWLMLMWLRQSKIIDNVDRKGGIGDERYRLSVVNAATQRMEAITELVGDLPETFSAVDYSEGLQMVGRMVAASDDDGRPVTAIGRAIRDYIMVGDGTTASRGGTTVPTGPGDAPQPEQ